jgi:hypothetical protein
MCQVKLKSIYLKSSKYNVNNVKIDKLSKRHLSKLVARLIKTYQIDPSFCPNVTNQKYYKNLRYLVFKRYVEKSITYNPWHDLISECLKQADYLLDDFFDLLYQHNDIEEICKWMKIMNINCDKLKEPVYYLIGIGFSLTDVYFFSNRLSVTLINLPKTTRTILNLRFWSS